MTNLLETTRLQERGTLTLPQSIRERLGVEKGSMVAFVETDDGRIELRALEASVIEALDELGHALKEKGVSMDKWLAMGRKTRKELFAEMYPELT